MNFPNAVFHDNPFSGSRVATCGHTGVHGALIQLLVGESPRYIDGRDTKERRA
jgi:hypothetical protein